MKTIIYKIVALFVFLYSSQALSLDTTLDQKTDKIKTKIELSALFAKDQTIRYEFIELTKTNGYSLDYLAKHPVFINYMQKVDSDNLAELKTIYERSGWPTISAYGIVPNHQAYMIVLHATNDIPFQKKILALLIQLAKQGEAKRSQVAYLTDKIAVHLNQLQTYGTQGNCAKNHRWIPSPMIDPAHLNERRKNMGLNSFSNYIKQVAQYCP